MYKEESYFIPDASKAKEAYSNGLKSIKYASYYFFSSRDGRMIPIRIISMITNMLYRAETKLGTLSGTYTLQLNNCFCIVFQRKTIVNELEIQI